MGTAATVSSASDWSELVLRDDFGQRRHWLNGRVIENGTDVELLLEDGQVLRGTYEWSGMSARWPGIRVRLRVHHEPENGRPVYAVLALPPQALVRLPSP